MNRQHAHTVALHAKQGDRRDCARPLAALSPGKGAPTVAALKGRGWGRGGGGPGEQVNTCKGIIKVRKFPENQEGGGFC